MNAKRRLSKWKISAFVAVIACVIAAKFWNRPPEVVKVPPQAQPQPQKSAVAPPAETAPSRAEVLPEPVKETKPLLAPKAKDAQPRQAKSQVQKHPKEPLQDPDARAALALVGVDPAAEQYWLDAIHDSSLPDKEREDLMEDLNEAGFADPKNVTPDDLPLIVSRLELIQTVLPHADDFMASHLLEAQKDLATMYTQVTHQ
jgi:hypothetical protein